MNVKRIVVDELPSTCRMCKFQSVRPVKNGLRMYCSLKDKMVHNLRVRPDWCPLQLEEVCEWTVGKANFGEMVIIVGHPACGWKDISDMFLSQYTFCPSCGKRINYVEVE